MPLKNRTQRPAQSGAMLALLAAVIIVAPLPAHAQSSEPIALVKDQYPAFSPDGSKIVFESNRAGPEHQIFVMEVESGKVTQLTHSAEANETPTWSPDGSTIMFARDIEEHPRSAWEMFEMNADGSDQRRLTFARGHDGHAHYSFDGEHIAFNSSRVTDPAELTEEQHANREYNYEIYVMRRDGSDLRRLTQYEEWDTFPSISPDGGTLLWRRIVVEEGEDASQPRLNSELFTADMQGENIRNVSQHPDFDGYPQWSPDGQFVAFASNRDALDRGEFNLYLMHFASGRVTRVTETIEGVHQLRPSWSRDGSAIVYNRDYPDGRSEIHLLRLDAELLNAAAEG